MTSWINLKYITIPLWLYAGVHLFQGVFEFWKYANDKDAGFLIALAIGLYHLVWAAALIYGGHLNWIIFRDSSDPDDSKTYLS